MKKLFKVSRSDRYIVYEGQNGAVIIIFNDDYNFLEDSYYFTVVFDYKNNFEEAVPLEYQKKIIKEVFESKTLLHMVRQVK